MDEALKDVHTEHCCRVHGCKYGNDECTVESGEKLQSHPCEWCTEASDITVNLDTLSLHDLIDKNGPIIKVCLWFENNTTIWIDPSNNDED